MKMIGKLLKYIADQMNTREFFIAFITAISVLGLWLAISIPANSQPPFTDKPWGGWLGSTVTVGFWTTNGVAVATVPPVAATMPNRTHMIITNMGLDKVCVSTCSNNANLYLGYELGTASMNPSNQLCITGNGTFWLRANGSSVPVSVLQIQERP